MKSIILSIKPTYAKKIYSGEKTIELRKKLGKGFKRGARVYIYETSPIKAVTGSFVIKDCSIVEVEKIRCDYLAQACVSEGYFDSYYAESSHGCLIWVESPQLLKRQVKLDELRAMGVNAPQSFCYAKEKLESLVARLVT